MTGVAVVTGGASGIGAAVVDLLAERGFSVVVADVAASPPTDVSSSDSVAALAGRVAAEHGRCDVLVNCAGVVAVGDVLTVSEADWTRAFDVNVTGVWRTARAFIPLMPEGGAIVNVASAAALRAIPEMPAYVASKAAVVGLTRAMAIDHAPQGIRVNCVCPGLVDTPLARHAQEQRGGEARAAVRNFEPYLVKRTAEAAEIADAVVLLATNRYATGATLALDGGRSLH
ncbi:SDR family oxidoreductase [Amycolatopsis sp. NPDC047767]|uniref:SDR family NAD(P)-dependent oxidoreductase n=1 Tax=Amycolatopsis sp. NPDC047767 TaxID=3156765 RepID=UPI003454A53F